MKATAIVYWSLLRAYGLMPVKPLLCRVLRAMPLPHHKFYADLRFRGPFTVAVGAREFRMVHSGGTIENEIFWNGLDRGWERVSIGLWTRLCASARNILDVGANTGVYSLIAATVNPTARILAFEPSAAVFGLLEQNIQANRFSNVQARPWAVSDRDGHAVLYDLDDATLCSSSLNPEMLGPSVARREIQVRTRTLDSVVSEEGLRDVDLVKIDVEMHEVEVLAGFSAFLRRNRPAMLIEVLTDEIGRAIERQVSDLGYLFFDIDEQGPPERRDSIRRSRKYNYLLCPPATASVLGLPTG